MIVNLTVSTGTKVEESKLFSITPTTNRVLVSLRDLTLAKNDMVRSLMLNIFVSTGGSMACWCLS